MQKNPSKQTKPQTAPTHTAPGLKSPAFSAHFEEERYGKVSEDNFFATSVIEAQAELLC